MEKLIAYLRGGLASFKSDPVDTDYQRGYEAALRHTLEWAEEEHAKPPSKALR